MEQQTGPSPIRSEHVNALFVMLGRGLVGSVQVFIRSDYGDRALGLPHALAAVLLFLYPALWPVHQLASIWAFLILYIVAFNIRRVGVLRRRFSGHALQVHSRYDGRSYLHRVLPRVSERWIKAYAEPALVVIAGIALLTALPAIGTYLLVAAVLMSGEARAEHDRVRRRAQDMHDAMINQQIETDEFQHLRGHNRR